MPPYLLLSLGHFGTVRGHVTQIRALITQNFINKIRFDPLSKVVQKSILYIPTKFHLNMNVTRGADMRGRGRGEPKKPADSQNVQHWALIHTQDHQSEYITHHFHIDLCSAGEYNRFANLLRKVINQ